VAPRAAGASLTDVVVAVTRAGARLVERHLAAPFRELVELGALAPATWASADVTTLQLELRADATRIRTTVVPAGDVVGVRMVLTGAEGEPLAGERVSLKRHGRVMFSARTDADGQVAFPALERSVYEVACPSVPAVFRLNLR